MYQEISLLSIWIYDALNVNSTPWVCAVHSLHVGAGRILSQRGKKKWGNDDHH